MRVFPLCTAQETPDRVSFSTARSPFTRKASVAPDGTSPRADRSPVPEAPHERQAVPSFQPAYVQSPTVTGAAAAPDAAEKGVEAAVPSRGTRTTPLAVPIQTASPVAEGCCSTGSAFWPRRDDRLTERPSIQSRRSSGSRRAQWPATVVSETFAPSPLVATFVVVVDGSLPLNWIRTTERVDG